MIITSIQRFSLHDGPGIRTTVFFKGCTVHCPWCCNPENISFERQKYVKNGKEGVYGRYFTESELIEVLLRDKPFYGEYDATETNNKDISGGVTFSGGEPLVHLDKCINVLRKLRNERIHINVESALFVPEESVRSVIDFVDSLTVDIKIVDSSLCKQTIGGDMGLFNRNLRYSLCCNKSIILRIPLITGFTDNDDNIKNIADYIGTLNGDIKGVELLCGHHLGDEKYKSLIDAGYSINRPQHVKTEVQRIVQCKSIIERRTDFPVTVLTI